MKTYFKKKHMAEKYVENIFKGKVVILYYDFNKNKKCLYIKSKQEYIGTIDTNNINSLEIDRPVVHISNELEKILREKYNRYISNNLWIMSKKDIEILKTDKEVKRLYRKKRAKRSVDSLSSCCYIW